MEPARSGRRPARVEGLLAWTRDGATDHRWSPRWLWTPQPDKPFAWTILVGGNGTGKTQLAKELGRALARRAEFGDSAEGSCALAVWKRSAPRLVCWYERIAPWARGASIPWDAGLVGKLAHRHEGSRVERLKEWLPRAPTLLILDDPAPGLSEKVISILDARKDRFWYPVRLLIVDQFIPADVPIRADSSGTVWHDRNDPSEHRTPFVLPDVRFDVAQFRTVLANGYWVVGTDGAPELKRGDGEIQALWDRKDLERLVDVVEGNPVLLALAVHWLRPTAAHRKGRTVGDLLDDRVHLLDDEEKEFVEPAAASLRELVAHRLVSERIEELFQGVGAIAPGGGEDPLRMSIACATIADGIPRKEAVAVFRLPDTDHEKLHRLFRMRAAQSQRSRRSALGYSGLASSVRSRTRRFSRMPNGSTRSSAKPGAFTPTARSSRSRGPGSLQGRSHASRRAWSLRPRATGASSSWRRRALPVCLARAARAHACDRRRLGR